MRLNPKRPRSAKAGRGTPIRNLKSVNAITLLELLIATSLLVFIISVVSGICRSSLRMFRDAQSVAQAQRYAMRPMAHMAKELQGAIRFIQVSTAELRFTVYTTITPPTTADRWYVFQNNQIIYDTDSNHNSGNEQVIGTHIVSPTTFTISSNGIIADIGITATDNSGLNPYTITSTVEAKYGATPPVI